MSYVGASITFVLVWWLSFFVILPIRNEKSLKFIPENFGKILKSKVLTTTFITFIIWLTIILVANLEF